MEQTVKTHLSNARYHEFYEKYKHLIRFIIVGCINTGVDFLTFTILQSFFGVEKLICQSAGYSLGIVNSFMMNKLWTFESKSTKFETANQFVKFIIVNAVSLGVSLLGLKFFNEGCRLNVYVSKLMVTFIAQVVNYAGYKLWIFKIRKFQN